MHSVVTVPLIEKSYTFFFTPEVSLKRSVSHFGKRRAICLISHIIIIVEIDGTNWEKT